MHKIAFPSRWWIALFATAAGNTSMRASSPLARRCLWSTCRMVSCCQASRTCCARQRKRSCRTSTASAAAMRHAGGTVVWVITTWQREVRR